MVCEVIPIKNIIMKHVMIWSFKNVDSLQPLMIKTMGGVSFSSWVEPSGVGWSGDSSGVLLGFEFMLIEMLLYME